MVPDFRAIFEQMPECYLILMPDVPRFTIAAVSDAYARATNTVREQIIGRALFEVFPDNPNDPHADGVKKLTDSLGRVLTNKMVDFMAVQKYDIPRQGGTGADFEVRYWSPNNSPVLDAGGDVRYIIHHVVDVTEQETLIRTYGGTVDASGARPMTQVKRIEMLVVEREIRMSELKKEIAELKGR